MNKAIEYIQKSELVISHAGVGTIILCKEYGVPIIILPRRRRYGEHMNDHQLEIAKVLEERGDKSIYMIYEEGQLEDKITEVLRSQKTFAPTNNIGRANLIRTIREFIEKI
jgi:UDP-N-acetylglucosamine transferase subunit ALG13